MLRIILLATALVISGCGSKEKSSEAATETAKESVKSTGKKMAKKVESTAKARVAETMETIVCSYNNDSRKISSVKLENGGCEVHYDKFGEKKVVATANLDLGYCSQMANKVSNNLEEAGFTCK